MHLKNLIQRKFSLPTIHFSGAILTFGRLLAIKCNQQVIPNSTIDLQVVQPHVQVPTQQTVQQGGFFSSNMLSFTNLNWTGKLWFHHVTSYLVGGQIGDLPQNSSENKPPAPMASY